jgi:large subunit ribosomal protein L13
MTKTWTPKGEITDQKWWLVDATDVPMGRLAARVASILRGKHKPTFTPYRDCGDFVVIINAEKVRLTGNKGKELLHWHTGWPDGLRAITREKLRAQKPVFALREAIRLMLPKNALGHQMIRKLKICAGPQHKHQAQKPETLVLG